MTAKSNDSGFFLSFFFFYQKSHFRTFVDETIFSTFFIGLAC